MSHRIVYDCDLARLPPVVRGMVSSLEVAAAGLYHRAGTMSKGKVGHLSKPGNIITT